MIKHDLLLWLIAHYSYCIKEYKKFGTDYKAGYEFLKTQNCNLGICLVAECEFNYEFMLNWVYKYKGNRLLYICDIPTQSECALLSLNYRLMILYRELKNDQG